MQFEASGVGTAAYRAEGDLSLYSTANLATRAQIREQPLKTDPWRLATTQ